MCSLPNELMSPRIERAKTSKGWATHERRRKAAERRIAESATTVFTQPEDPSQRHWESIEGTVRRSFDEDDAMLRLFKKHKGFFRRFTDGRRAVELNLDSSDYVRLQDEYLNNPTSPSYNLDFWDRVSPILRLITAETSKLSTRR